MKESVFSSNDGHVQKTFSTLNASKLYPNVRTVEVFIEKLDDHIDQSYKKLKESRSRHIRKKSNQSVTEIKYSQSTTKLKRINKINLKRKPIQSQDNNFSTPIAKQTLQAPQTQQFVLLSNKDVMQYINMVYEIYNIPDPLETDRSLTKSRIHCETNKKAIRINRSSQREVGSASTTKVRKPNAQIYLTPFTVEDHQLMNKKQSEKRKLQLIKLKPNTHRNKQTSISNLKQKQHNFYNIQCETDKSYLNRIQPQACTPQFGQVAQMFRYCFMCQQPILQCNLRNHQQTCKQLKQTAKKEISEIIQILDTKIQRLMKQIERNLINKKQKQICLQFNRIKQTVTNWMKGLPSEDLTIKLKTKREHTSSPSVTYNERWRQQFIKVQESIRHSVCSSLQVLNKLNWFCKLRQNVGKHFAG